MTELNLFQQKISALLPSVELKFNEPLAKHTSFRIGGPAEVLAFPKNPEQLRDCYEPLLREEDEQIGQIVKAADKLSAYAKCVAEQRMGNPEFESAAQQTMDSMLEMDRPELTWFIDHCLHAFSCNLDQMGF